MTVPGDTRQCAFYCCMAAWRYTVAGTVSSSLNSESAPFILGVSSQLSSEHLYVRALETLRGWPAFRCRFQSCCRTTEFMGSTFKPADLYRIARLRTLCPDIANVGL